MTDLIVLLKNKVKKPLLKLEKKSIGYIDSETSSKIYYKIDNRKFSIEIREVLEQEV